MFAVFDENFCMYYQNIVLHFSDKNVLNKKDPKYFLCVIFLTVLMYFPFPYLPSTFVEVKYNAP